MSGIRLAGIVGAATITLLALSGCVGEQGGYGLPGQPANSPQACPRIYDPVCGGRGGDMRTFPNACEAGAAGYSVRYQGQCQAGPGGPVGPGQYGAGGPNGQPPQAGNGSQQMCPMVYQPVCARQGNQTRTFPNDCQARNAGYQVLYQSECLGNAAGGQNGASAQPAPGAVPPASGSAGSGAGAATGAGQAGANAALQAQKPAGGQSCSRSFVPVCGKKGSEQKTFINACMAQSEGYTVSGQGRCK